MSSNPVIVWFRNDLRIDDNEALSAAIKLNCPIVPVFFRSTDEDDQWAAGAASRWWLHHSLLGLQAELQALGSQLVIRTGRVDEEIRKMIDETGANAVFWNRNYEPQIFERDQQLQVSLQKRSMHVETFTGNLLFEPGEIETKQNKPYQVFTPFWKTCLSQLEPVEPLSAPKKTVSPGEWPKSEAVESLNLLPTLDWVTGLRESWTPGSAGAKKVLKQFLTKGVSNYQTGRDRPDMTGTSRLSPHLHFGEISPRQVWHAVQNNCRTDGRTSEGQSVEKFLNEIGWREFAHHVLHHFPHTPEQPLRSQFRSFPWVSDKLALKAWKRGQTGYPIVDAGMRELWSTGWMHNRVRMIVGSFLTKDLLISWQEGAKWFWDTLVDADLANNTLGWQWISGCGADAAPYFRVFNPVTQGRKYDPDGKYVRQWVPELVKMPDRWIHEPWNASVEILDEANVTLGEDYPNPMVDHAAARRAALDIFAMMKEK